MITLKQESVLVKKLKSLTELELQAVFEELYDHIVSNRMYPMVETVFQLPDLTNEISDLENELEEVREERSDFKSMCERACTVLDLIENIDDEVQKGLDKAIQILSDPACFKVIDKPCGSCTDRTRVGEEISKSGGEGIVCSK
jgi:hypothetical protein